MKFSCIFCGECCKRYTITVTQDDARRITNFTGLNPSSFLTIMRPHESVADTYFDTPKIVLGGKDDNVLALKEKRNACMFLKKNQCSIYKARPLVCRPFPFTYTLKGKNDVKFTLNEEVRDFCKGIGIGSDEFDLSKLKKNVLAMETERDRLKKKIQKWNKKVPNTIINQPRLPDLIEFLLPPTKQEC